MIQMFERRRTRLGNLTPEQLQAAVQSSSAIRAALRSGALNNMAVMLPNTGVEDPGGAISPGASTDYLPLAVAGLAGFAVGAAGIVALMRRRKKG